MCAYLFLMCTYRCTQFECGSRILGAAAGLCTIYAVHKTVHFICIYRCALFYIYCRLLPVVLMCTYRCALFRRFCRQQCIIYMHMQGCAFFLIYTLYFPVYFMHTLMYTQNGCQNVHARVCTLWGRQANLGAAAGCGQIKECIKKRMHTFYSVHLWL